MSCIPIFSCDDELEGSDGVSAISPEVNQFQIFFGAM